jgi:hypothetical protein
MQIVPHNAWNRNSIPIGPAIAACAIYAFGVNWNGKTHVNLGK